jgi:hypothetical protein
VKGEVVMNAKEAKRIADEVHLQRAFGSIESVRKRVKDASEGGYTACHITLPQEAVQRVKKAMEDDGFEVAVQTHDEYGQLAYASVVVRWEAA